MTDPNGTITIPNIKNGMPHTTITIPTMYYNVLKKWASVGRTIDSAIEQANNYIDLANVVNDSREDTEAEIDLEQPEYTITELLELKQSLDACNAACKEHYITTQE
jgi:hypothetical protein